VPGRGRGWWRLPGHSKQHGQHRAFGGNYFGCCFCFEFYYFLICIIYFFACAGSSLLHGLCSHCRERGLLSSCRAQASHCSGFSCGGAGASSRCTPPPRRGSGSARWLLSCKRGHRGLWAHTHTYTQSYSNTNTATHTHSHRPKNPDIRYTRVHTQTITHTQRP